MLKDICFFIANCSTILVYSATERSNKQQKTLKCDHCINEFYFKATILAFMLNWECNRVRTCYVNKD